MPLDTRAWHGGFRWIMIGTVLVVGVSVVAVLTHAMGWW